MHKRYDRSLLNCGRRWYSLTTMKNLTTEEYYTPYQLKLPLEISKIIDADDPVCTFSEVMDHIDLSKYFAGKGSRMGRPRCDAVKLLKIILFAFMEGGYSSLRELEKRCRTDIRYMWLLDEMEPPSFMTFGNFIRHELNGCIEDIFRYLNCRNESGQLVCPNGKAFTHYADTPIRGNKYGRTEELHICSDCTGCPYRQQCYKGKGDRRVIRLNRELTQFHEEVLNNLECVHGALLRMNRSIQAEGAYGIIKWDRSYKRAFRRGLEYVILEFTMISCGFNLYKYHNKKMKLRSSAA